MATESFAYDNPKYLARHSSQLNCVAGTADTLAAKFLAFTAMKIKSITANVNTAGTAAGAAYTIYQGTTSVGALSMGTSAAAASVSNGISADITLAAGEYVSLHRIATYGAVMAAAVQIEWEFVPGATVTA